MNVRLNRNLLDGKMLRLSQLLDAQTKKVFCQIKSKMPDPDDDGVKPWESFLTSK